MSISTKFGPPRGIRCLMSAARRYRGRKLTSGTFRFYIEHTKVRLYFAAVLVTSSSILGFLSHQSWTSHEFHSRSFVNQHAGRSITGSAYTPLEQDPERVRIASRAAAAGSEIRTVRIATQVGDSPWSSQGESPARSSTLSFDPRKRNYRWPRRPIWTRHPVTPIWCGP